MKLRLRAFALVVAVVVSSFAFASSASAQAPTTGIAPINLAGSACTIAGVSGVGEVTSGTLTINRFTTQAGQLAANVTVTATCVVGTATQTLTRTLTIPVNTAASSGSCQILDLVLGPLNLDLLGLVVHLDTVHLNITAQQGPGNLLGNLLCGIANALNGGAPANVLANLLNQILAILGP
jgi:hypothetical protein